LFSNSNYANHISITPKILSITKIIYIQFHDLESS
jgi:hypothetical protein